MSNQQDGGAQFRAVETRRGRQRLQEVEGFGFRIMRAAGVVRAVEAGKAFRAYILRGDPVRWRAGWEVMCIQTGKHLNSACGENVYLMYCYPPQTNAHTAAPRRGTLGPRCAISLWRRVCRGKIMLRAPALALSVA